ncbi:Polysaccharide biosynthesis/export protein [Lacunisphaera limnophila]|uniref:Polysaccharide biosynthesis/export protein n=1 Tax=Lacunisphaera limnophila TaxID=1838286 RepID=A0A1D8AS92_9BACT|nr:polysaccharide biosynthesis/export family protein [Lacunisphaera limnophila]AOS43729.1 Polysaccharide biosynthesis/export protein [Lacunisphaera limnophila]
MSRLVSRTLRTAGLMLGLVVSLSAQTQANTDYILRPSDLVRVQIFQEEDLERVVRITQENTITLPLIGTVEVKDRTVRQTEELIRALYDKDYLVNPQVNLTVMEYSESTVQVVGAVNRPGAVPFPPEQKLTLVEAIARAGGQSRIADLRKVRLSRTTTDGRTENFTVNVDELMKQGSGEQWYLTKGDVIFVPERLL